MIKTKEDLLFYMEEDIRMAKWKAQLTIMDKIKEIFFPNYSRRFITSLRKAEFYLNNNSSIFNKIRFYYYSMLHSKYGTKLCIDIGYNITGPGLVLPHGNVVVNMNATIGSNCKILPFVTIGWLGSKEKPTAIPKIGNRVYIGTGAKIIGDVTIADSVVIGANSLVTKSILEPNTTWGGYPLRKISDKGSGDFL